MVGERLNSRTLELVLDGTLIMHPTSTAHTPRTHIDIDCHDHAFNSTWHHLFVSSATNALFFLAACRRDIKRKTKGRHNAPSAEPQEPQVCSEEARRRNFQIAVRDYEEIGYTPNCSGCQGAGPHCH